jgi:MinD superfamily P-loop ATPase
VIEERCTACGNCETVCAYGAARVDGKAFIYPAACTGCGLCVSVCPADAIRQEYYV